MGDNLVISRIHTTRQERQFLRGFCRRMNEGCGGQVRWTPALALAAFAVHGLRKRMAQRAEFHAALEARAPLPSSGASALISEAASVPLVCTTAGGAKAVRP